MALVLIALLVLVPLALLVVDLARGGAKGAPLAGTSHARTFGEHGSLTRGPRPNWPRKPS